MCKILITLHTSELYTHITKTYYIQHSLIGNHIMITRTINILLYLLDVNYSGQYYRLITNSKKTTTPEYRPIDELGILEWPSSQNICTSGRLSPGQFTNGQLILIFPVVIVSLSISICFCFQGRLFIQFSSFVFSSTSSIIFLSMSSCSLVMFPVFQVRDFTGNIILGDKCWKIRLGNYNKQWIGGRINNRIGQVKVIVYG